MPQLVAEADAGGKTEKALGTCFSGLRKGASGVRLQVKDILVWSDERPETPAQGSEAWSMPGLVLASGSDPHCFWQGNGGGRLFARTSLVASQHLAALPSAPEDLIPTFMAQVDDVDNFFGLPASSHFCRVMLVAVADLESKSTPVFRRGDLSWQ